VSAAVQLFDNSTRSRVERKVLASENDGPRASSASLCVRVCGEERQAAWREE
jgi:hypothetical protein